MQPLPRHWTTVGTTAEKPGTGRVEVTLWGWSARSLADAAAVARSRAEDLARRGLPAGRIRGDYYPRRPVREEILQEVTGEDGSLLAVLTRNRYGAVVLNTDVLLVADVDVPLLDPRAARGRRPGLLGRLFGGGNAASAADGDAAPALEPAADAAAHARIAAFLARHGDWGVHVHRTFAGYRVLVSGSGARPDDPAATELLEALGSDALYVRLCRAQHSFRARLSPKPWRLPLPSLGGSWPVDDAGAARRRRWVQDYEAAGADRAVCRRVSWTGVEPGTADERTVLALHDRLTGAAAPRPLA